MSKTKTKAELSFEIDLLIVTATDIESKALHHLLQPIQEYNEFITCHVNAHTFFLGEIGGYKIAHIQCEMGSLGSKGSLIVTSDAIEIWKPLAVCMVGICFGANATDQTIGDIIVASQIIGYDTQKVKQSGIIGRPRYFRAGRILMDRLRALKLEDIQYDIDFFNKKRSPILQGELLSGEKLIDDQGFRDAILKEHPEALGGEMEAIGVTSACEARGVECLIIKSICDFADGNKGINKINYQTQAAIASVNLLKIFLEKTTDLKTVFERKTGKQSLTSAAQNFSTPNPLFNAYSPEHEVFYLVRQFDHEIEGYANNFDVWVFGPTGIGKTCCLSRTAEKLSWPKISVCLANTTYEYESILDELFQNLHIRHSKEQGDSISKVEKIMRIIEIIKNESSSYLIVFDEVPADAFASVLHLVYDVKKQANENGISIKFFVSSHDDPFEITNITEKYLEVIHFTPFAEWTTEELQELAMWINNELNLMDRETVYRLSELPVDNPRKLKTILKQFKAAKSAYAYGNGELLEKIMGDLYER